MLMFSSCNPKFFAVRHIHYPVNPSSNNFHTDTVVPSSDQCFTEAVGLLPPSDHYCIETVAPSGDHYGIDLVVPSSDHCCIETVPPSSDYHGTTKIAPLSDHLHTSSSSFVSFTQCSPTCGRMPLPSLSLCPGRQSYTPRLVGGRRGGGHTKSKRT